MDRKNINKLKIIVYAKQIIKEEGVDKLTVSNLVNKCGMSNRTFYKLFPTKEDLIKELMSQPDLEAAKFQEEKENILKKARELFARQGYEETNMENIAKAVGTSRNTLYKYFRNKEELLESCIIYEMEAIREEAEKEFKSSDNPLDSFKKYIQNHCYYISNYKDNNLFEEAQLRIPQNENIHKHSTEFFRFFTDELKNVLEAGIKTGIFKKDIDVESMTVIVISAINGLEFSLKNNPELDIENRIKETLIELLLNTILVSRQ